MRRIGSSALAIAMGAAGTAHAACPATNQFLYSFTTEAAATLAYGTTYTRTATNGLGQSQSFTFTVAQNGLSLTTLDTGTIVQMPAITTLINDGGATNRNLVFGGTFSARTASITSGVRTIQATFDFGATRVRDLEIQVNDIDFTNNQFRDWLHVSGTGAAGYVPSIVTPHGTNNGAGPRTIAASSLALGAAATPFPQTASEVVGIGASGNNANTGTLTASFIQPVNSAVIAYGNYPLQTGETATGQQGAGIQFVRFCPMPVVALSKTSAPWSDPQNGTINPKLIPGGDLTYTLTVTNSNSSPVDASSLVLTDPIPAALTFYNGDIDDAGPLTTNYEFGAGTSGLTFAPANLTYSNNGGASYAYTPAAGYDAAVTAVRLAPQGTMAANSSFTLRFRARIK